MMMMKTNRLSTDRLYSVSQPAANSVAGVGPAIGLLHRRLVRPAGDDHQVGEQQRAQDDEGGDLEPAGDAVTGGGFCGERQHTRADLRRDSEHRRSLPPPGERATDGAGDRSGPRDDDTAARGYSPPTTVRG
jgi:hypothetical protein